VHGSDSAQISETLDYLIKANLIPFFYQLNEDEISRSKGVNRAIQLRWTAYFKVSNCGYKVYKNIDGVTFTEVFSQLAPSGYDENWNKIAVSESEHWYFDCSGD